MRIARKLMLLAVMALAAMAMMAPAANATEPLEILNEAGTAHCTGVGIPPLCPLHAEGEATLRTHFFGVEANEARCHVEFEGRTSEDGDGLITAVTNTNGGHGESNCATVSPPCTGSLPWNSHAEALDDDTAHLTTENVCIDPSEFLTCSGSFETIIDEEGPQAPGHEIQHTVVTDQRIGSAFCEIDLSGEVETDGTHQAIHLRHVGE